MQAIGMVEGIVLITHHKFGSHLLGCNMQESIVVQLQLTLTSSWQENKTQKLNPLQMKRFTHQFNHWIPHHMPWHVAEHTTYNSRNQLRTPLNISQIFSTSGMHDELHSLHTLQD